MKDCRCAAWWLMALLLPATAPNARATQILVPEDHDLQTALLQAAPGDTVSVAGGTLVEAAVGMPSGVTLLSRAPLENSIARFLAYDLAEPSVVEGFLFTSLESLVEGDGGWLGGIVENADLTFRSCHFEDFVSKWGFGGELDHPTTDARRCPLALFTASHVSFTACSFRGNWVEGVDDTGLGCIEAHGAELDVRDCVFEEQAQPILAGRACTLTVTGSEFRNCGFGVILASGPLTMMGNLLVGSGPHYWAEGFPGDEIYCVDLPTVRAYDTVELVGNTFVDNPAQTHDPSTCPLPPPDLRRPLVYVTEGNLGTLERNLFIGMTGPAVEAPATVELACNDAWDSEAVLWTGGIGDVTGTNGNLSEQALFCGRAGGDYTLSVHSPAATADCGLMGAFPTACDIETPVAVREFAAWWEGSAVRLRWELAEPEQVELFVERLDAKGLHEIYRGRAAGFVDREAPAEGSLHYALGLLQGGERIPGQAWVTPSGERAALRTRLLGAVPNPFNPRTEIRFELASPGDAKLEIYDVAGRRILGWQFTDLPIGEHHVIWQGTDGDGARVASGVYHLRLEAGGRFSTQRLALLR